MYLSLMIYKPIYFIMLIFISLEINMLPYFDICVCLHSVYILLNIKSLFHTFSPLQIYVTQLRFTFTTYLFTCTLRGSLLRSFPLTW